jgi:chromosome segregation ATPase
MNGPTPATPASDWEARLHKVELTVERIDTVVEVLKSRDASGAARLLDNDMAVVKVDIAALKADIAALRPALATSNSHVAELRIDTTLRVESLSERIDHIEDQLAGLDARMRVMEVAQSHLSGHLDGRIDALEANLCGRIDMQGAELRGRIDAQGAELRARIDAQGVELRGRIDAQGAELRGRADVLDQREDETGRKIDDLRTTVVENGKKLDALIVSRSSDIKYFVGGLATVTVALAGVMAKGFHWI